MGLIQTHDQLRFSYQAIVYGAHKLSEVNGKVSVLNSEVFLFELVVMLNLYIFVCVFLLNFIVYYYFFFYICQFYSIILPVQVYFLSLIQW